MEHTVETPADLAAEIKRKLSQTYAPDVIKIGLVGRIHNVRHTEMTFAMAEEGTPPHWVKLRSNETRLSDPAVSYTWISHAANKAIFFTDIFEAARSKRLPEQYRTLPLKLETQISSGVLLAIRTRCILGGISLHWMTRTDDDIRAQLQSAEAQQRLRAEIENVIFEHRLVWRTVILQSLGLTKRQIQIFQTESHESDTDKAKALNISATSLARTWRNIADCLGEDSRKAIKPMVFHYLSTGWLHTDDELDALFDGMLSQLLKSDPFWNTLI